MRFQVALFVVVLALGAGCGSDEDGGSGRPDGTGGVGGDVGAGGSGGGTGGDTGGGTGGTGGTGGSGGGVPGFRAIGLDEEGAAVPLHASAMVEFELDREVVGTGTFRIELDSDLPKGVWVGTSPTAAPGSFEGLEVGGGSSLARLYLISGRDVETLEERTTLRFRGVGADWEGTSEFDARVVPWVSNLRDSGDGSLRDLVESVPALVSNPTITFSPLLVAPDRGLKTIAVESPIVIDADMRIEAPLGPTGQPLLVLDGKEATRIFQVGTPEGSGDGPRAKVHLYGLKLVRGRHDGHAGCLENSHDLTLENMGFENCVAVETGVGGPFDGAGGGLLSGAGATIRIVNTRFVGNEGMVGGAAMILGPASIEGSRFDGNVATIMGGALALTGRETEVEIKDTNFVENESAYGGAIGSDVKKLVIAEGCVFQGNRAEGLAEGEGLPPGGGALRLMGMTGDEVVEILDARFSRNDAMGGGGAIYAEVVTLRIDRSRFLDNVSRFPLLPPPFFGDPSVSKGGAIAVFSYRGAGVEVASTLEIRRSLLQGNRASHGGALYVDGAFEMDRCAVVENTAGAWGGGLDLVHLSPGRIVNTTIARNVSEQGGGLYVHLKSDLEMAYVTVIENQATGGPDEATGRPGPVGGLALADASLTMGRSVIAKNEATGGITRDIWVEPDRGSSVATFVTRGDNLIGDIHGSSKLISPDILINPFLGDRAGYTETVGDEGLLDPGLEPLRQITTTDGTSTWVAFPAPGGEAIDKIPAERCRNALFTWEEDQLGKTRPIGGGCDVGAAER